MWELLRRDAEAAGAPPFHGIRLRQLRAWLDAQEARQLFKIPRKVKAFRSFDLPSTPLRTLISIMKAILELEPSAAPA